MSKWQNEYIKSVFLIFVSFTLFFSKSYAQRCRNLTSDARRLYLSQDILQEQLYLNNLVVQFDESKTRYINNVKSAQDLVQEIQDGLEELPQDLDQAIENEKSLISFAEGVAEEQFSLAEKLGSALDLLEASTIYGSKCMALDMELE